jgi:hypothetical protein
MTKLPRWQAARWPGLVAAVLTCGLLTMVAGVFPHTAATSFTVSTETPFSDSGPVPAPTAVPVSRSTSAAACMSCST